MYTGKPISPPPNSNTLNYTACSDVTTPKCLRLLYGFDSYKPTEAKNGKNSIAVVEYLSEYAQHNNLEAALEQFTVPYFGKQAARETFTVIGNAGNPQGEQYSGIEAELDIQVVTQLTYPTDTVMYSILYDNESDSIWNEWLATVLGQESVPPTISTSYGDNEQDDTYLYATRVCTEMMELGAQGVTLLFSSGDSGVASYFQTCDGPDNNIFVPSFPSTCPYVTSVGATKLYPDGTERAVKEPLAPTYSSGGGMSI